MPRPFVVLMRCACGAKLVSENGDHIDFNFAQVVVFKDSGRIAGRCRRCGRLHALPGYEGPLIVREGERWAQEPTSM